MTITYALVRDEHERRLRSDFVSLTDEASLAGLMELPTDDLGPVPRRFRRMVGRTWIDDVVAVVVEDVDGTPWATRLLAVPTRPVEVEIHAKRWREGVNAAHHWNGFASRVLQFDALSDGELAIAMTEVGYYGIGLKVGPAGASRTLVGPSPFQPRLFTAARWSFAETVYDQFRQLTAGWLSPRSR
ncbi:hypothetical protein [Cryobacterium sp. 10S3]|uniref:hypothetical protein n=2 Tax=Bacteria TaxID=2 RepID=UPI002B22A984|nr:hypothetical protein [Cryobacterium sp. 10S3]